MNEYAIAHPIGSVLAGALALLALAGALDLVLPKGDVCPSPALGVAVLEAPHAPCADGDREHPPVD